MLTLFKFFFLGGDITQCFHWLLKKCGFPYQADPDSFHDNMLLDKLKQDACHIELDICGCKELTFTVNKPDSPVYKYTIQVRFIKLILYPL